MSLMCTCAILALKFGVPVIITVNAFATDSPAELDLSASREVGKTSTAVCVYFSNTAKFGVPVVIAVNAFATDSSAELDLVCSASREAGETVKCQT